MSMWRNRPDGKTVRRNKIPGQWAWLPREAIESPAYRALSLSGHRVLARIQLEQLYHAGKDNGRLPVTFQDFEDYGIHRHAIAPAIRELEALGFIRITQIGRAGNREFCIPNKFALTHLPTDDNPSPTNDWRRIKTNEEAVAIADAARKAPARYGKLSRKSSVKKQNSTPGKRTSHRCGNRTSSPENLGAETALLGLAETVLLSISWVGAPTSTLFVPEPVAANPKPVLEPAVPPVDDWRRNSKAEAERMHSADDDLSIPEFLRRTVK